MASWTFETYTQGDKSVSYRWDKNNGYEMFYGVKHNGIVYTIYHNTYISKESAERAYKRYVRKLKRGEI